MSRILVVEDEEHLAQGLRFNLELEGYAVEAVESGEAALELLEGDSAFDLVLLDVMLPGRDGFDVVRELRDRGRFVPVLMLTARGRADDVLRGFEAGADDYLPKPFDLPILLARIHSLLRRRDWVREREQQGAPDRVFVFGDRRVELDAQRLVHGDAVQDLTLMETNLLRYLIRNEGKAVSRKALLEEVWGVREDTDTRAVDNFIVRLRRYLEDEPSKPKHLLTVRGLGYRFVAEPEA
ncbi:MAG: response regulator [Acidobacteria bacterium]|nr:response regulator [Acidobacteriota bacterium]